MFLRMLPSEIAKYRHHMLTLRLFEADVMSQLRTHVPSSLHLAYMCMPDIPDAISQFNSRVTCESKQAYRT
jgi:hypothetical protein